MNIQMIQKDCHDLAVEKGWWQDPTPDQEAADVRLAVLGRVHCAVSNATEAARDGADAEETWNRMLVEIYGFRDAFVLGAEKWRGGDARLISKLTLMHSEISEAFAEMWDVPPGPLSLHMRFDKDKFGQDKPEGVIVELADVVIRIFDFCGRNALDLAQAIAVKHAFNRGRKHRHGGRLA